MKNVNTIEVMHSSVLSNSAIHLWHRVVSPSMSMSFPVHCVPEKDSVEYPDNGSPHHQTKKDGWSEINSQEEENKAINL